MPKVSVIVPIYKVEQFLCRCIDSILAQTYTDFELILVDDESPDRCGAICDEYTAKDSRVVVIHKKNGGVATARNVALDMAQGKYVAFCDSDDYWENTLLETAVGVMSREQADCVAFGVHFHNPDGTISDRVLCSERFDFQCQQDNVDFLIQVLFRRTHGWEMWNHIFCRDIIEQYHIRCCTSCNNLAEDMGFVCRYMLHSKRLCCIPDCLYHYTIRDGSLMRKSDGKFRLNDMNEVSYDVGQEYYRTITEPAVRRQFPILHLLMVYYQLGKLCKTPDFLRIPGEIRKLSRLKWWKKNIRGLFFCYRYLRAHYDPHLAKRILMFATYLQHGNWKLYSYETGLYYRWYSRKQR